MSADDILSVNVLYDEKYTYNSFSAFEEDGGRDFAYTLIARIKPLTVGILHFLTEVPVEVRDSGKPVSLSVAVDNKTLTCTGETTMPTEISFGEQSSSVSENNNWQKYDTLTVGETVTEADYAEMTVKTAEFTDTVKPTNPSGYYTYYEVKSADKTYAHIVIDFKNLKGTGANPDEIANVEVLYDDRYTYTAFAAIETSGGSDFTYTNITRIDPLSVGTLHYLAEVPSEVRDSGKTVVFIVTFNRTAYSYILVS